MELGQRLKGYRNAAGMTQDELADRLYITRQTVSNWENDKSYPDIHSLLMLGELFHVSLDTLIKGDLDMMKEKIDREKVRTFRRYSNVLGILMVAMVASPLLLFQWLGIPGMVIWGLLFAATMYFAIKVEKIKRKEDIHTYREIVAFTRGERLDNLEKAREEGKRSYQRIAALLVGAAAGAGVCAVAAWLMSLL